MTKNRTKVRTNVHHPAWYTCLALLLLLYSCKPLISLFDPYVYREAVSLKVDVINLIEKMDKEDFSVYRQQTEDIRTRLLKIAEYEKRRPQNTESNRQWDILLNGPKLPEGTPRNGGLFQLFDLWQSKGKLSVAMVPEAREQITNCFDVILSSENSKIKKGVALDKTE